MPVEELDLRAKMLWDTLKRITTAPEDKSLNQVREEAIIQTLEEVVEQARTLALVEDVHAAGRTPEEAIRAFAEYRGLGEVTQIEALEDGDSKYTWGRRFHAGGVSMKAAGLEVPGGALITWWK